MHIIGINGFKRSGKGETGKAIESLALGVHALGFADKLKVFAARSLGWTDKHMTDAERIALMDQAKERWVMDIFREESQLPTPAKAFFSLNEFPNPSVLYQIKRWTGRQFLQYMGTEARTVFGEDFWVNQVLPTPPSSLDQYLAYPTAAVRDMYPDTHVLVFTDMRFENEAQRILDLGGKNIRIIRPGAESDGHDSEQRLSSLLIDHEIVNDGTLNDLRWEVNKFLEVEGIIE